MSGKSLNDAAKRVHNLEEMVTHWLDISRIENGTLTQQKVSLSLDSIISRSVEEMAPLCRKKGIALEINSPQKLTTHNRRHGKSGARIYQYHR